MLLGLQLPSQARLITRLVTLSESQSFYVLKLCVHYLCASHMHTSPPPPPNEGCSAEPRTANVLGLGANKHTVIASGGIPLQGQRKDYQLHKGSCHGSILQTYAIK